VLKPARSCSHLFFVCSAAALFLSPLCLPGPCPALKPSGAWKEDIVVPTDPFFVSTVPDGLRWIKFTILVCRPEIACFQDGRSYTFHYDFLRDHVDAFAALSPEEFDLRTLRAEGQEAILGAVLIPPETDSSDGSPYEYGFQLIRRDPYKLQEVLAVFAVLKDHVHAPAGTKIFYIPTFEQLRAAETYAEELKEAGVLLGSVDMWEHSTRVLVPGWALGTLRYVPADRVEEAFLKGELKPSDILLVDGVPARTPLVAGIISLRPVTPNSHAAILAATFGVPLLYAAEPLTASRARKLVGKRILLKAQNDPFRPKVRLIDTTGAISEEDLKKLLALKEPPALDLKPVEPLGVYVVPTDGLGTEDIKHVGGKAANFGYLRRAIPDASPVAAAITFDLWLQFLGQVLPTGETLREHIDSILASYSYMPADMQAFAADMASLRRLFTDPSQTRFTPEQKEAILRGLLDPRFGFDPALRLRFRSSTNVEDTEHFTGAGLYNSYSGCLADELDADDLGPSACDPKRRNERGVFRAIRRVFASFYNDNAVLERLRRKVAEHQVGMAILVHHSFPDEIELANGVATLTKRRGSYELRLVTQKGAVSVTNPEPGAVPEEVSVIVAGQTPYVTLVRPSNLVIVGATVLVFPEEYRRLALLLTTAADTYCRRTGKDQVTLDFEYKKTAPEGKLVVKQLREIPQVSANQSVTPFLLNEQVTYKTYQGDSGTVFGNWRLNTHITLQTQSTWLTEEILKQGVFTEFTMTFTDGCNVRTRWGVLPALPEYRSELDGNDLVVSWEFPDLADPRRYRLRVPEVPQAVPLTLCPIFTQRDLSRGFLHLTAVYEKPLTGLTPPAGSLGPVTEETVLLAPEEPEGDLRPQVRYLEDRKNGVFVTTRFFWPPAPAGPVAGYTAPLAGFAETVIQGLISEPIVLRSPFAQAYRPLHHNFVEHFLFVPKLEPSLTRETHEKLRQAEVGFIYAVRNLDGTAEIRVLGPEALDPCPCPPFLRGDVNGDGRLEVSDAVALMAYLFVGGPGPQPLEAGDANTDGLLDIADAVFLLAHLFAGGPAPSPAPCPEGPDPP